MDTWTFSSEFVFCFVYKICCWCMCMFYRRKYHTPLRFPYCSWEDSYKPKTCRKTDLARPSRSPLSLSVQHHCPINLRFQIEGFRTSPKSKECCRDPLWPCKLPCSLKPNLPSNSTLLTGFGPLRPHCGPRRRLDCGGQRTGPVWSMQSFAFRSQESWDSSRPPSLHRSFRRWGTQRQRPRT